MKIIGIDLGTTNTYIYEAADDGVATPILLNGISDERGSIATAVMYENGEPILAGNIAESEFYSNLAARSKRRIASSFKPEIAFGEPAAMTAMTDFLRILGKAMSDYLAGDVNVYAGMPALSREDFSVNLSACFVNAGWPKPYFGRESDAALVSCLQSGILDLNDLDNKCLIVDFGGGTYDYTCVRDFDALQNGGDLLYGGRLFDDLFFQIFCRADSTFARKIAKSPYAWYVHWVECRWQKEHFSDFLRHHSNDNKGCVLHLPWFGADGKRHDSYIHDYTRDRFIKDAENYKASPEMLQRLQEYVDRGGLSVEARDLLAGRAIGLISWLRALLNKVDGRASIKKIVLTGGSSRWFFAPEIALQACSGAQIAPSKKNYEDIAIGLAVYPVLIASYDRVKKLLEQSLPRYTKDFLRLTQTIIDSQIEDIVKKCGQRIVSYDVMPVLETAGRQKATIQDIENACAENIKNDSELAAIADEGGAQLMKRLQSVLNESLETWLRENGVILVPRFDLPAEAISEEFLNNINVKILRLDSLDLVRNTLIKALPYMAGLGAAGLVAHSGELFSAAASGCLAYGATWLAGKTMPNLLARRKIPAFLLKPGKLRAIIEKNQAYIERELDKNLDPIRKKIISEVEEKLKNTPEEALARLSILNQINVTKR